MVQELAGAAVSQKPCMRTVAAHALVCKVGSASRVSPCGHELAHGSTRSSRRTEDSRWPEMGRLQRPLRFVRASLHTYIQAGGQRRRLAQHGSAASRNTTVLPTCTPISDSSSLRGRSCRCAVNASAFLMSFPPRTARGPPADRRSHGSRTAVDCPGSSSSVATLDESVLPSVQSQKVEALLQREWEIKRGSSNEAGKHRVES